MKGGSGTGRGAKVAAGSSMEAPDESPIDVPLKPAVQPRYDILSMPDVQDQVQEIYYNKYRVVGIVTRMLLCLI